MKRILTILLVCILATPAVFADALNDVRGRIKARLPEIVSIWKREAVGENNRGYLSPRGSLSAPEQALVAAENADRELLYSLLAQRHNLGAEEVGRAQARQIYRDSPRGYLVQNEEGDWLKKP